MADIQRRSEEEEGIIENQSLLIRKQDEEDEEINGEEETRKKKKKKKRKTSRKAKLATLFSSPFTKLKKISTNSSSTNLNSSSTNPFPDSGNIEINSCYMCYGYIKKNKKKKDLGSSPISSDPNSPNFSYDLCKALIEKNDFFSEQCNVHLDIV